MSNAVVAPTYKKVIEDVLKNVTEEFEALGIDESVLSELKTSWESKLLHSKVANFDEEFADTLVKQEQWNGLDNHDYDANEGGSKDSQILQSDDTVEQDSKHIGSDGESGGGSNLGSKRKAENSQQNGTEEGGSEQTESRREGSPAPPAKRIKTNNEDDDSPAPGGESRGAENEDDADDINSDLDDSEDEDEANEADEGSGDIVLCQYDKVSRVKTKWKCSLKDGIVNVDGRDFLFHKANCDFQW